MLRQCPHRARQARDGENMKAEITKEGKVWLSPENALETFALKMWWANSRNKKAGTRQDYTSTTSIPRHAIMRRFFIKNMR